MLMTGIPKCCAMVWLSTLKAVLEPPIKMMRGDGTEYSRRCLSAAAAM